MTPQRLKDILWVFALLGLAAVVLRVTAGLGASTGLSDGVPWGLWKVVNMIAGVALATGGFTIAFGSHVLGIKSLKPLVRPAILIAFLGYGASCFALLMDIGLPHRFWHPFVFWNVHSFLFEVFWCVILYFTVTVIELSPVALEGSRHPKFLSFLKKITTPVVLFGIAFSCMHHSSLGSLFLVSPTRLHALWYTAWLPVHFILSAVGTGLLGVVLVTLFVSGIYRRSAPVALLGKVARAASIILLLYVMLKLGDLISRGALGLAFAGTFEGNLFLLEMGATILAIALLFNPGVRQSPKGLMTAALFAVGGLVLNRMNVGIFGYLRTADTSYLPTLSELLLTLGIPAMAGLVFLYAVERLRVFDLGDPVAAAPSCATASSFEPSTRVWKGTFLDPFQRVSLIFVVVIPIAVAMLSGSAGGEEPAVPTVRAPRAVDAMRHLLRLDGDRDGDAVLFQHETHKRLLGGEDSCGLCHHLDVPGDRFTPCYRCHRAMRTETRIFDHEQHTRMIAARDGHEGTLAGNHSCDRCHEVGEPRSGASSIACIECHEEDMRMQELEGETQQHLATGYAKAMHVACTRCHEAEPVAKNGPELAECWICHPRAD